MSLIRLQQCARLTQHADLGLIIVSFIAPPDGVSQHYPSRQPSGRKRRGGAFTCQKPWPANQRHAYDMGAPELKTGLIGVWERFT